MESKPRVKPHCLIMSMTAWSFIPSCHRNEPLLVLSNVTAVTEVQSASFGLVLRVQHIFANSVNFLIIWGLSVAIFHSRCMCVSYGTVLAAVLSMRGRIVCLPVCGAPWWLLFQHSIMLRRFFHHLVWYRALSLWHACIRSLGMIFIP